MAALEGFVRKYAKRYTDDLFISWAVLILIGRNNAEKQPQFLLSPSSVLNYFELDKPKHASYLGVTDSTLLKSKERL